MANGSRIIAGLKDAIAHARGDVSDAEFEDADTLAATLTNEAMKKIEAHGADNMMAVYSMWVEITRILAVGGFTADELTRDLQWHVAYQTSEGGFSE